MRFYVLDSLNTLSGVTDGYAILVPGDWDDYGFVTQFKLSIFDSNSIQYTIGTTKIGMVGQAGNPNPHNPNTKDVLPNQFESLDETFFSLGQSDSYYSNLMLLEKTDLRDSILSSLKDVSKISEALKIAKKESVFSTSLTRTISISQITGQFKRILEGGAKLSPFHFAYTRPIQNEFSEMSLHFNVIPESKPPTNIHAVVGRNGGGKTTLLNSMIENLLKNNGSQFASFSEHISTDTRAANLDLYGNREMEQLPENYFSRLVSVSFSAFDQNTPPPDRPNTNNALSFKYIGLRKRPQPETVSLTNSEKTLSLKTDLELHMECLAALKICFSESYRKDRWLQAIQILESDQNFGEMNLGDLCLKSQVDLTTQVPRLLKKMSSGHLIIFLSITLLVTAVEEKTFVILDEPECHLHPPLLSAYIRALSELLQNRNGLAFIATHSPVVLQEIPKSCVWKLIRFGKSINLSRPSIETFGENIGSLTREIFGLEVVKSGFHKMLADEVQTGKAVEDIEAVFKNQLGSDARALLYALVANRDNT